MPSAGQPPPSGPPEEPAYGTPEPPPARGPWPGERGEAGFESPGANERPGEYRPGEYGAPEQRWGYGQQPVHGQPGYGPQAYGGYPAATLPAGVVLAPMPRRLAARVIDIVIVTVVAALLHPILFGSKFATSQDTSVPGNPVTGQPATTGGTVTTSFTGLALLIGAFFVYEVALTAWRGGTVGKLAAGIRVVRADDGGRAGWGSSVLRWLVPFAGFVFCLVGELLVWLSPFFDSGGRRQGWHDKAATTIVVLR